MKNDKPNGKVTNIEKQMMLDEMIENAPFMISYFIQDAKLLFERRKALVEAGFTEQEALEIIKARGAQA